jgi:hypothetical protein
VHDSQKLDDVLDLSNTGKEVWADSAYRSVQIEAGLEEKGLQSRIHRRAARNRPLTERAGEVQDWDDEPRLQHSPPGSARADGGCARLSTLTGGVRAASCKRTARSPASVKTVSPWHERCNPLAQLGQKSPKAGFVRGPLEPAPGGGGPKKSGTSNRHRGCGKILKNSAKVV